MKKLVFTAFLAAIALASCNKHHKSAYKRSSSGGQTSASAAAKTDNSKATACAPTSKESSTSSVDNRQQQIIDQSMGSKAYPEPRTNFQGASGPGTGSSYAAFSYGSQGLRETCPAQTSPKDFSSNGGSTGGSGLVQDSLVQSNQQNVGLAPDTLSASAEEFSSTKASNNSQNQVNEFISEPEDNASNLNESNSPMTKEQSPVNKPASDSLNNASKSEFDQVPW